MTTPQPAFGTAGRVVGLAAASVTVAGLAGVLLGLLTVGSSAALGAGIATVIVLGFFGFGTLSLGAFIRAMPALALPMALLTYAFQVVMVGLVALLLKRSGALGETVHPTWLGVGVLALTVVWMLAHVSAVIRTRIPLYDLSQEQAERVSPEPRSGVPTDAW